MPRTKCRLKFRINLAAACLSNALISVTNVWMSYLGVPQAVAAYEHGVDLLEDLLPSSLGEQRPGEITTTTALQAVRSPRAYRTTRQHGMQNEVANDCPANSLEHMTASGGADGSKLTDHSSILGRTCK